MHRGQISFDLIMAILFALVFFSAFSVLGTQIVELQKDTAIRLQLKQIALDSSQIISSAKSLENSDSFLLSYDIPKIIVPGESKYKKCSVSISGGTVTASFGNIQETSAYSEPLGASIPSQIDCGKTLEVVK